MSLPRLCLLCLCLVLVIAAVVAAGCSSSPASDCTADPFQCGSGTTCSLSACSSCIQCDPSNCVPQFACLDSGTGVSGSGCSAMVGTATCSDGLACVVEGAQGTCVSYCNAVNSCSSGYTCQEKTVQVGPSPQPLIHVCEPEDGGEPDGPDYQFDGSQPPPPSDSGEKADIGMSDGPRALPEGGLPR